MKNTIEQKIKTYINARYDEKKPRLTTPQVVEYANTKGANWRVHSTSCEKRTSCAGMRYSTGGGTREYLGYRVGRKGEIRDFFDSTETYRTIGDLLRQLPNYDSLRN